jgi:hypothetical protein
MINHSQSLVKKNKLVIIITKVDRIHFVLHYRELGLLEGVAKQPLFLGHFRWPNNSQWPWGSSANPRYAQRGQLNTSNLVLSD